MHLILRAPEPLVLDAIVYSYLTRSAGTNVMNYLRPDVTENAIQSDEHTSHLDRGPACSEMLEQQMTACRQQCHGLIVHLTLTEDNGAARTVESQLQHGITRELPTRFHRQKSDILSLVMTLLQNRTKYTNVRGTLGISKYERLLALSVLLTGPFPRDNQHCSDGLKGLA
jgi:hypothetical protein